MNDEPQELTSGAIFEEYGERIRRYILGMVHDATEAEDLTQETFLRVHRKLDTLRDPKTLSVWLYRIATRVCYDRFRQPSYRNPPASLDAAAEERGAEPAELADLEAPRVDQLLDQREMSACVRRYVEQLPDTYRTALFLHDFHGMTNPEIAERVGVSLPTVKIRLHRARRALAGVLAGG